MTFSGSPNIIPSSIVTPNSRIQRAFVSGSTYASAFPALSAKADVLNTVGAGTPGTTDPTTGLAFIARPVGSVVNVGVIGAADNGTMNFRVWRYYLMDNAASPDVAPTKWQWVPFPGAQIAATIGAKVGIASGIVTASEGYADTMSVTTDYGPPPLGVRIVTGPSPDNTIAYAEIDFMGASYVGLEGTLSGGTATSFDFLVFGVTGA